MFCSCLNHLQGRNCQFRHEPSALGSQTICPRWQQGKCYISRCNMRHANLNNQRRHSDSRPRFARTSPKADASEFQVKNIEEIRRDKRQRFGQPAEPLKATDCNVTTGPHCNLGNWQLNQNDWPMRREDETIRECAVDAAAFVTEPPAKEQANNTDTDDVSIPRPVKHVWTDEEWEIFDSVFLEPAIVNDPAALAEYLAPRLEERKKTKKRQRIIYVDALCEEIGTLPKRGRWDFHCLFP